MSLPARAAKPPTAAPQAAAQPVRKLRKGELLFAEGENSRAMYLLKGGIIRLFKKKGESDIELDTVRTGQILGELAFLDGNPRSASAEALTDCELMEISGPSFQETLARVPDWLKILLKTVVTRLRTASTRIRQLETASTAYDYSDRDGKRSAQYQYLTPIEILKLATALLLVGSRNGTESSEGIDVRVGLLQRYANQVMGVPVAKITSFLDVLSQVGVVSVEDDSGKVYLRDIEFLEQAIAYLNEENLLEPAKRHDISIRGFLIMSLIAKHLPKYKKDEATGACSVNMADIRKLEVNAAGKEPFRMDEFSELVKLGYATNVSVKSNDEIYTLVKPEAFLQAYRLQRVAVAIKAINEQKRKGGGSSR
jgi:CRP/FNR family transcriptional regulator, cyclic AMP receptor protein